MPRKCPQCGELIDADATDCERCMEKTGFSDPDGSTNANIRFDDVPPLPSKAADREEANYAAALEELDSGDFVRGVWANAFADSLGDEAKARALYLRRRAQLLEEDAQKGGGVRDT